LNLEFMATNTEVGVKITVDGSDAVQSVGSIKKQLREATQDLIAMRAKFGATSDEAIKAAKRVAELKDEIGDAKAFTDAFNPDAKFKAFGAALQGVAGGFAAVQGAQALFGAESKELEETLVKVQGALALSQGIDSVLESADAFGTLGAKMAKIPIIQKVITAAQFLWNAAVSANPIGALVAVVVALIAAGTALVKFFINSSKEAKNNEAAVKANTKALEQQTKQAERNADQLQRNQKYTLELAKANGASTKEIRALELKLIDEKIAMIAAARATALATAEKNRNYLATLKQNDANEELIKKQQEVTNKSVEEANKQTKNLDAANIEKVELIRRQNVDVVKETKKGEEDAAKKVQEARDKAKEKAKENAKEKADAEKDLQGQLSAIRNEGILNEIKDENERAKKKIELDLKDRERQINASKATEATKAALIAEERKKANAAIAKIDADANAANIKKEEDFQNQLNTLIVQNQLKATKDARERERLDLENGFFERRQAILNNETTTAEQKKLLIEQLAVNERIATQQLQEKFAQEDQAKQIKKLDDIINNQNLAAEIRLQAITDEEALLNESLANRTISQEEYNKKYKDLADARTKIDELEAQQKINNAKSIGDTLSQLGELVGKETAAGKVAAVAAAGINTYAAAWSMFKQATENPVTKVFPAFPFIQAGLAVAGGLANIKKIIAVKTPKGSSGGGASVPSGGVPTIPNAPIPPQAETTLLNQGQVNQIGNVAARAYVVESDVSGNQQRIQRLERAARIA
jgi:hypothetical protein